MDLEECATTVMKEIKRLLKEVDTGKVDLFLRALDGAAHIFCSASGRSGNILRCFCMRLMHLGYDAYVAGETITPPIGPEDLLVVLSGSGETLCTQAVGQRAKEAGATVFAITGVGGSPVAQLADHFICLPGSSKTTPRGAKLRSEQPVGSLFEQAAFILLESIVLGLYRLKGGAARILLDRHANLE